MTGMRTSSFGPGLAVAAAALALAGCGSPDSAIHQPTPVPRVRVPDKIGKTGKTIPFNDGMSLQVMWVRSTRVIGSETPQQAQGRFVVVRLSAVNRTGQDVSIAKSDVRLRDGTGRWHAPSHSPAVEAFGENVFMDYEEVPEYTPPYLAKGGDAAEIPDRYSHWGYLVFDVPRRAVAGSVLEVAYSRYDEEVGDPGGWSEPPRGPTGASARIRLGV